MRWSPEDAARLREVWRTSQPAELENMFQRPYKSIHDKAYKMRLGVRDIRRETPWTDDELAILHRLWPTWSAGNIAKKLGRTRNAVSGAGNRLGLRKQAPEEVGSVAPSSAAPGGSCPPQAAHLLPTVPLSSSRGCQWPMWDDVPDGVFCDQKREPGRPYCPLHAARAYRRETA